MVLLGQEYWDSERTGTSTSNQHLNSYIINKLATWLYPIFQTYLRRIVGHSWTTVLTGNMLTESMITCKTMEKKWKINIEFDYLTKINLKTPKHMQTCSDTQAEVRPTPQQRANMINFSCWSWAQTRTICIRKILNKPVVWMIYLLSSQKENANHRYPFLKGKLRSNIWLRNRNYHSSSIASSNKSIFNL